MSRKQRLELTWIGKQVRPRLEPRVLVLDPAHSYLSDKQKVDEKGFDNHLIFGDNLLALKALEANYTGKIKCAFIDPPYNTGTAFEYYDDGLEHSVWLGLMHDRLQIIRNLLMDDGSVWIMIDENELHYLKVLCDEVFGRANFVVQNTIKRSAPTGHKAINPAPVQVADFCIVYAKDKNKWRYKQQYVSRDFDKAYNKFILNLQENPERWEIITLRKAIKKLGKNLKIFLSQIRTASFALPNQISRG